ncbi:MAG: PorT family protein [Bacteroidaceae bacterium]|nr:PorT family protein [Bacteroidaceae bacterium]
MKKLLLMAAAAMMAAMSIHAQHEEGDYTLQPRVGISLSNFRGDADAKMKVNLTFGLDAEYFLTDQFSLGVGLLFINQGAKYHYETENYTMDIYYAALPITANYYLLPGLSVKAGIQPAWRANTKIKARGETLDFDKALMFLFQDDDVKANRLDVAIPIGLSYEFKGVTLDARYNLGLVKVFHGLDDSIHHNTLIVTLGYKF